MVGNRDVFQAAVDCWMALIFLGTADKLHRKGLTITTEAHESNPSVTDNVPRGDEVSGDRGSARGGDWDIAFAGESKFLQRDHGPMEF